MIALWINNPGSDTDHRHRHRGGMLTKTPPPTELQIPDTVTTLNFSQRQHGWHFDTANQDASNGHINFIEDTVEPSVACPGLSP